MVKTVLLAVICLFFSCLQVDDTSAASAQKEVSFNYTLTGVHRQSLIMNHTRAAEHVSAELIIRSYEDDTTERVPWFLTVDTENKTVSSRMTRVLKEGHYDFQLNVYMGPYYYSGYTQGIEVTNNSNVNLTIRPVIGNNNINLSVTEIPKLKLSYPSVDVQEIAEPRIGFILNGAEEHIVDLDKNTGLSEVYVNFNEGMQNLSLNFYNGSVQIGRSRKEQENFMIVPGTIIPMDIIPLTVKMGTEITIDGGQAEFYLTVPKAVAEEAGGLENLTTIFKLASTKNGLVEKKLSLNQSGEDYTARVIIENYHYDTVVIDLEFKHGDETIGHGVSSSTPLNSYFNIIQLPLNLMRRAVVSGSLMSDVGIQVYDENNTPLSGVTIRVNDRIAGITGSGTFGSPGFLSFFQTPGEYVISGEQEGLTGSVLTTVKPLEVKNLFLILKKNLPGNIAQVEAGRDHALFLTDDGTLLAVGSNNSRQLGDGTSTDRMYPVEVMKDVKDMSAGGYHTLILKKDNSLWTVGGNFDGQLGDDTPEYRSTPVQIMENVADIEAGTFHSLVLKQDKTLWAFGSNQDGQLGDGTTTNSSTPIQISSDVISISTKGYSSYFIKSDNSLWATGNNESGQLGIGSNENQSIPVKVMDGVQTVTSGNYNVFIHTADGKLLAAGHNYYGQLCDGTQTDQPTPVLLPGDFKDVIPGHGSSLIIKKDNSLWGIGSNSLGELGDGTTIRRESPVKIVNNVISVSTDSSHTLFITEDNSVWAMGRNYERQLGIGSVDYVSSPTKVF